MWKKYLLCFLPPPYEAIEIHHAEQNNGDDRRKGLTKEESKSRDTQSSEQKRDETRYFAAKRADWRGLCLGFKLRDAHAKSSCATKEDPLGQNMPNEGRRGSQ